MSDNFVYVLGHAYLIIRSGNGSAARCHFICYIVQIENKQYHQMFASWRERFYVCQ